MASDLTIKVGTDPSEAAIPWYNRCPKLGEIMKTTTPEFLTDLASALSLENRPQQVEKGESRSSVVVSQRLGTHTDKTKKGRGKR